MRGNFVSRNAEFVAARPLESNNDIWWKVIFIVPLTGVKHYLLVFLFEAYFLSRAKLTPNAAILILNVLVSVDYRRYSCAGADEGLCSLVYYFGFVTLLTKKH